MTEFVGFGGNRTKDGKNWPDCYCYTCDRDIHHLGIMSHRAAHKRRNEDCTISFSDGREVTYNFSKA